MSACAFLEVSDAHFWEAIRMCCNDGNGVLTWLSVLQWNILLDR